MKLMFIESRRKNFNLDISVIKKVISKKIHILYSIQYKELALKIKEMLEQEDYIITGFEQVLGCSVVNSKEEMLLIGSGRFHAINIAFRSGKPVYVYDNGKIEKIKEEEIERYNRKIKAKQSKFLMADNIGILVTTKLGQYKLQEAMEFKEKMKNKYKDKKFYVFLSETIGINEFENFNINFWINFACPGIELDNTDVINYNNLLK